MHADRQRKQEGASEQTSDSIDLPYCEGIQVTAYAGFGLMAFHIRPKPYAFLILRAGCDGD